MRPLFSEALLHPCLLSTSQKDPFLPLSVRWHGGHWECLPPPLKGSTLCSPQIFPHPLGLPAEARAGTPILAGRPALVGPWRPLAHPWKLVWSPPRALERLGLGFSFPNRPCFSLSTVVGKPCSRSQGLGQVAHVSLVHAVPSPAGFPMCCLGALPPSAWTCLPRVPSTSLQKHGAQTCHQLSTHCGQLSLGKGL